VRHRADLFFDLPDAAADAIARALAPEANANEVPKTRADVARTPGGLRVTLHADDLASLRAAANSYLRWIEAARKAADLGRP
jgi:tRNA threonylcarbamoyladenosine modification (KEOPS) complex  Pcc1 subunit